MAFVSFISIFVVQTIGTLLGKPCTNKLIVIIVITVLGLNTITGDPVVYVVAHKIRKLIRRSRLKIILKIS